MSAQEFRPGDRVRHNGLNESTALVLGSRSLSAPDFCAENLTLVSRPIHPEPGQVAVLLDGVEVATLSAIADNMTVEPIRRRRLRAILDRAREASR